MNYLRQQFGNRERVNAPEKKFHLSLKKKQLKDSERESAKENNSAAANRALDVYNYRNIGLDDSQSSLPGSQNYRLRLSEESVEKLPCNYGSDRFRGTQNPNETTVSVSDSNSSNDNSPLRDPGVKKSYRIYPTPFYADRSIPTIVIESSDSEDASSKANEQGGGMITLDSDDDSVLNAVKIGKKDPFDRLKRSEDNSGLSFASALRDKSVAIQLSDEFSSKNRIGAKCRADSSSGSSSTHYSPDIDRAERGGRLSKGRIISESSSGGEIDKAGINLEKFVKNRKKSCSNGSKNSLDKSKRKSLSSDDSSSRKNPLGNVTCRSGLKCPTKPYDSVKLTKKDAERIFKGAKVGGNSHWTPKLGLPFSTPESESLSSYPQGRKDGKVIDETASQVLIAESSSEDDIVSNSSVDLKPSKTHVSRFMTNAPNQEQQYAGLSDRKKTDISHWLMNNTPGSSSSSSIVSDSNRNSSFGNSSLERFELKHETPNNRGKISKPGTSEKVHSVPRSIERFIYKGKTSVVKNQTPLGVSGLTEDARPYLNEGTPKDETQTPRPKKSLPIVKTVETLDMKDCADILDKLYGNVWRDKADAVFTPTTEPRRKRYPTDKARSKTERKHTSKPAKDDKQIFSSSEEDEFDAFTKDIRPNFNSTKKKPIRDSFIDDKSPSENSSESFYHTALTNPRESKDNRWPPKPPLVSASTRKAVAICDSESDEPENYPLIPEKDSNKKRLSFSEDASSSSTSEFDPGELVLPKPKAKKAPAKTSRQIPKSTINLESPETNSCDKKCKSFLASLSASVPIINCHPEARVYRDNYKNKKEELCKYLFKLYNEKIFEGKLPADMAIEWNVRMRGTAGFCYNRKSVKSLGGIVRSSRIVLATKILDTPDRLRDTLVHEMCHAAAWLINNVSDGHGPFWKGWASKAVKTFPELPPIRRCHDYKIKTKFTYKCTKCGYSIGRHSKSLNTESKRCGHCYGKFELLINRTTRSGTTQVATPVQTRTPTGFALFVKENYHSVKKDRRSIKHAEVMKILGQQFAAVKLGKKSVNDVRN